MLEHKNSLTTDAYAVWEPKWQAVLSEAPWQQWIKDDDFFDCKDYFLEQMHSWIIKNDLNTINVTSIEPFRFYRKDSIIGTTQALDEFHWRHRGKTLRIFRGEYGYNKRVYETYTGFVPQLDYLDKSTGDYVPLIKNEYVIISLPFAGIGDKHYHMDEMLDDALQSDTPVLVDCAWYGTCMNIEFDFLHPAITEVCFSTSKGLGCGRYRAGIRYSNYDDGMICQHNNYNHLVGSNMQLAIWMMEHFRSDHIPYKFREMQHELCNELKITPSNCMHIGIAPRTDEWKGFELAGLHYRVGLNKLVKLRRQNKL
jgi:hypothetical protein|tara:strand:+ start:1956 stop:2888 length:933 start_codon:yes stop_codon:yes gene_type:complete